MVIDSTRAIVTIGAASATSTGRECDRAAVLILVMPACTDTVPDVTMKPVTHTINMMANQKRMELPAVCPRLMVS